METAATKGIPEPRNTARLHVLDSLGFGTFCGINVTNSLIRRRVRTAKQTNSIIWRCRSGTELGYCTQ